MSLPDCSRWFSAKGRRVGGLCTTILPSQKGNDRMKTLPDLSQTASRREFLCRIGGGFGGIALTHLLGPENLFADETVSLSAPLPARRVKSAPRPARVKRVIQLFMNGGASQMDLFDYKPELVKRHGKKFDPGTGERIVAATSEPGKILKPAFEFRQHGHCGRWISSLLPHVATCVND